MSEACSHVGATLFALETGVRMRSSTTCTQEKSKWLMPTYVKDVCMKVFISCGFSPTVIYLFGFWFIIMGFDHNNKQFSHLLGCTSLNTVLYNI